MMEAETRRKLSALYNEHRYLYDSLKNDEMPWFDSILSGIADPRYPALGTALGTLVTHLRSYHDEKCIVLIDEYDHPLNTAFHQEYYTDARNFFASLLGNLLKVGIII